MTRLAPVLARIIGGSIVIAAKGRAHGVRSKMIWGGSLIANEVGPLIFEQFLPRALASGQLVPSPAPIVVGHGLNRIPDALERQRLGVSAAILVVTV